jgi:hypothetical protein
VKAIDSDHKHSRRCFLCFSKTDSRGLAPTTRPDGADTVEQLSELHQSLLERRSAMQSDPRQ